MPPTLHNGTHYVQHAANGISNGIRRTKGVILAQRARHSEGNSIHTLIVVQHTHVLMYTQMYARACTHTHTHACTTMLQTLKYLNV